MADSSAPAQYVKKETLLLVAAACLLIGFLGGIVFSVYKLDTGQGTVTATRTQPGAPQQPQVSPEQAQQALALEKEVAANAGNTQAWIDLGHLYFDMGEPQKAIRAYTRALELDPNNAAVLTDLGVMYRRTGQFDKALEAFDRAIDLAPTLAQPRFNKGIVLMFDLNRQEEALQAWEGLLKINPDATAPNGQPLREIIESYRRQQDQQPQSAAPPKGQGQPQGEPPQQEQPAAQPKAAQ